MTTQNMHNIPKISKFFNSPTDAQVKCFKSNFKIGIKTARIMRSLVMVNAPKHVKKGDVFMSILM
jgi:hypothetical protein